MEDSKSDLFSPPPPPPSASSSPPFPVPAPGATTGGAASSGSVYQRRRQHRQQHGERQRGHDEGGGLDVDYRSKGAVHGARIGRFAHAQVVVQQERKECNGGGVGAGGGDGSDVLLDDRTGLMDVGGDSDENASAAAALQVNEFDDYMPLVGEGEAGAGLQFGQVNAVLNSGADNLPLATESVGGDEAWIAQGIDPSNYGLGNDGDSIFEEAIRELINKSSQAAGYGRTAEVGEEQMQGLDATRQLHTAPQTSHCSTNCSDSMLFSIDDVEGGSGHEQVGRLPEDPGASEFVASAGVDASMSDQDLFATEDERQYVQARVGSADTLHVSEKQISDQIESASSPVNYSSEVLEDGADCLQGVSWPTAYEQELYPPLQQDADVGLEAEQPSGGPEVASAPQRGSENVLGPPENEEGSKCGHLAFTEESKDDLSPLNGETSDHDDILDGADQVEVVEDSDEDGNAGVDDQGERERSPSSPASSKEDGMESNGTLLPHPSVQPNASEDLATVVSAKKPRGKLGRPLKKHHVNGVPVTSANSKASDELSRNENAVVEGPKEGETLPMWVKWRGKWEAAIRCSILDCPTTTLKAKPNYSKKKHVAVYFPSARLFSWVDTQHTCPIEENPVPLLNGTHASQREAVRDGSVPRQRMLLKLGGEILDISDRLHIKAVTEPAQDVNVWKTFAKEAAAATTYAELGELLVRLHLTIAPIYIKCKWISQRYAYWKEDCAKAANAAALQKLTKELISAVRWEDVAPLWNASEQPELDPEWEHWKGDAFEEKDSEDDKDEKASKAPRDESPIGAQLSAGSGSKRFKEQARARHQNQRSADALESSQKRLKSASVSPEVKFVRGPGSSSFGHATTAFRSPLVHLSPLLKDKEVGVSGGGPAAFSSGLCSAYLKRKTRRCNRQAKEDITYCGKHKHLADPENSGKELESEGGLAWESGLCSASLGQQFTRCENSTSEGSIFCQAHIHLGGTVQSGDKAEVPFSASSKEEGRCHGITNRGIQCTHKPQDGSPFCAKHLLQGTEGQDQEVEARTFVQGAEGSASKRARTPSDTGKMNGSPVHIQVGQVSSHHAIPGSHGNGLLQGSSATTSADGNVAAENDGVTRKRKWASGFFNRQAAHNVKSPLSQGQDIPGTLLRCKGRTTRNDEQCLFRARAGHALCTKHLLAAEGGRKLLLEEDSKISSTSAAVSSARTLLEKYLKSAEGIRSDAFSNAAKKQVLKVTRGEAAQDYATAEELLKLVTVEMSKLETILRPTPSVDEETRSEMKSVLPVLVNGNGQSSSITGTAKVTKDLTCGLCGLAVLSQGGLGRHWRDSHRKEVIIFVKGYACRQCGQLYSRKHTVRRHWRKRHHNLPVRSPDWLAVCSTCDQRFEHHDSLLQHVCAEHPDQLSSPTLKSTALESGVGFPVGPEVAAETLVCDDCQEEFSTHWDLFHHKERTHTNLKNEVTGMRMDSSSGGDTKQGNNGDPSSQSELFGCRNCSKKFPSLSELGRHADAEHTLPAGPSGKSSTLSSSDSGRVKLQVRRKSDEQGSGFWQTAAMGPRRSKKKGRFLKQPSEKNKEKEVAKDALLLRMKAAVQTAQLRNLRQLKRGEVPAARPRKALYSLTKGGQMLPFDGDSKSGVNSPADKELLDMAQSVCCQSKLLTTLHEKYIKLPDQLLVRVSQVCAEANVELEWLADGYLCPSGCKELRLAVDTAEESTACEPLMAVKAEEANKLEDVDEIRKSQPNSGRLDLKPKTVIISPDLSNGQELVPVVCSVEQDVVDSWRRTHKDWSSSSETFKPDSFNYITKRVLNPSLGVDPENYKVGCSCGGPQCSPESCDHVDIFDNDNLEALDIYGEPMKGRFPYDNNGCIILEEGYLVYECNSSCHCQQACQNRVLQKGVTVKLEVFRTLQKGWAVRAAQMIPRGTFVCEYLGEVLHDEEANKRGERYDQVGCSYLYDIDAHLDTSGRVGRVKPFVIDATKHGNVARFINHSCAPNLVNYQVLVDSIDCQLAHIGLFASRDIENGEELAYDYRYKLLPGKGCPCHCGAPNCRGRLY